MKSSKLFIGSLLAAGSTLIVSAGEVVGTKAVAPTPTPAVTGTVSLGYISIYEFRGVDYGSNMVEAAAGLATTYNGFGFSATAWYATVNDDARNNNTANELDLTLGITKSVGPVSLSGGYIYYNFFGASATNTQELYLGASMEIIAGISAGVTAYYDIDLYNGWYGDLNLSKTCKVNDSISVVTTIGLGLADNTALQAKLNGSDLNGYQQFYAMVSVPWTIREGLTLAPYLRYVNADSNLKSDINFNPPYNVDGQDHLIGGVKLTLAF